MLETLGNVATHDILLYMMRENVSTMPDYLSGCQSISREVFVTPQRLHAGLPPSQEEIKAYLQATLHDGTYSSNHRFRISQKGTSWLKHLKKMFESLGIILGYITKVRIEMSTFSKL